MLSGLMSNLYWSGGDLTLTSNEFAHTHIEIHYLLHSDTHLRASLSLDELHFQMVVKSFG